MMPVSRPEYTVDTCLDSDAMCALLQHALPDAASGRVVIDALRVTNVRRSSSRHRNPHPLTLRYELALRDTASGVATRRDYYGKVYRNGASAEAPLGTAALRLPQLDLLLWAWPNDPGLPQLAGEVAALPSLELA